MKGSKKYFLFLIVLLAIRGPYIHASPDTENLYVNGFNSVLEEWDETGASPWLNDDTGNYLSTNIDEEWHEEFTFANHIGYEIINSVTFYIELKGPSARNDKVLCHIQVIEGGVWTEVLSQDPDADDYAWYSADLSVYANTWDKINYLKLRIEYKRAGSPKTQTLYARRSYIEIDFEQAQVQAEPETYTVSQSSDDVYVTRSTSFFDLTNVFPCGDYDSANYDYESGMRWEVNIPQGSTIESAYLKIVAQAKYGAIPETIIHGQDADDPVIFNNYTYYIARDRTSEFVTWTPSVWTAGITYTSGDISNIIQEIVNREGFGTHIVLFCSHEIGWGGVQRLLYGGSWDHATYDPPKLEVTWTPPPVIDPPELLFGAGFNASSPYVELHWNHSLVDVQFFEVQNSSDGESWTYLGQSTTANYTDTQVVNGTERYYRVRACNQTDSTWYNSSFSDVNFDMVYFIMAGANGEALPVDDYSIIFLAIGLILMLAIAFLYARDK